jgi:hypothetical protein
VTSSARFIVGIDLGTTHVVVAYARLPGSLRQEAALPEIRVHGVRQWVTRGEIAAKSLFPASLYAYLPGEIQHDPWGDAPWALGEFASHRGQEALGRVVASAKSWLCHAGVDRTAPILPWGLDDDPELPRISPVEASERLLRHVACSWAEEFPQDPLDAQEIVLTVPASFDEVARELTLLAARQAGLAVRLLEEPQAAFYDYLHQHGTSEIGDWVGQAEEPGLILVCDVGGGTTDLTLIRVGRDAQGSLELERVAVGRHLLLGGDNMDLALAHACEGRLVAPPDRLDARRFGQLVLACRAAKERLLGPEPQEQVAVTVLGSGSDLFSGKASTVLERVEVEQRVLDGFFPLVSRGSRPTRGRGGLLAFGLPYEADPAITRHLAGFLDRHAPDARGARALLLNGGVFRARRVVERVKSAVEAWGERPLQLLPETDPELAVARGAVAYRLALGGRGLRILGGAAHGYYVGIDPENGQRGRLALCVVPRGTGEGQRHVVSTHPLSLTVGRPVRFDLYASDRATHAAGEIVSIDHELYDRLPPVAVRFGAADSRAPETLPVVLEGELSAVGTLELACVEAGIAAPSARRFRLAFDLRTAAAAPDESTPRLPLGARSPARLTEPRAAIERVFGKSRKDVTQREVKDLVRTLEKCLGERSAWTTEITRSLGDELLRYPATRRRSADHERVFWMLIGYCLRPGFGHPEDPTRLERLVPLFDPGLAFPQETRGWQQFFIAWRRVAGGLDETAQDRILDTLEPWLRPSAVARQKPKAFRPLAPDELLELVSWLERLPSARRGEIGRALVERTWRSRDPRLWAAIGRIGARIPAYASLHHVVSPRTVEPWVEDLLREKWKEVPIAPRAALDLARVTGDRARDLTEPLRLEVARRMEEVGAPDPWVIAVRQLVLVREADRVERFGEDLPVGLRLLGLTGSF